MDGTASDLDRIMKKTEGLRTEQAVAEGCIFS